MRTDILKVVLLATGLVLVGCEKTESDEPAAEKGEQKAASAGGVTVPQDGKKFDPPIKPEEVPSCAWYCDMGTVHYAQMAEGHTCPVCKMKLKKKP